MSVQDDITKVQLKLNDNGTIWPQAELLRAYNDGYRRLLSNSSALKDHMCFDVPPRNSYTFCYEWEDSVLSGNIWMCMLGARTGRWRCTTRWEAQQAEHVGELPTDATTTTGQGIGITQQWERFICGGDADRNYDLVFPRNEKSPSRVRFNNTIMLPITTLELDQVHIHWPSFVGQPYWWTSGFGRVKTIEIYRIQTDYNQAYQLIYPQYLSGYESVGMPRNWSGVRTYTQDLTTVYAANTLAYTSQGEAQVLTTVRPKAETTIGTSWRVTYYQATDTAQSFCMQAWEADTLNAASTIRTGAIVGTYRWEFQFGAADVPLCIGMPRELSSPDRQYFPVNRGSGAYVTCGTLRAWGSSDGNFFVTYTAINQHDLGLTDSPDLLPSQMSKYIRYYVLSQAYGRQGEGQRMDLSAHWYARYERGFHFFRKLADVAFADKIYVREEVGMSEMRRVPLVQLPPQYERIW